MIKRDCISKYKMIYEADNQGGKSLTEKRLLASIKAMVSQNTTYKEVQQYGISKEIVLNITTFEKLDTSDDIRYMYDEKLFKVIKQVKIKNQHHSILIETAE